MRVALPTVDFDDDARRAIRASRGETGKATRVECAEFAENCIEFALRDVADHSLENPADELDDDELLDDELDDDDEEIEGIPNADFEELEDDLHIIDSWI